MHWGAPSGLEAGEQEEGQAGQAEGLQVDVLAEGDSLQAWGQA